MSPFNKSTTAEEVTSAFSSSIKNCTLLITGTSAGGIGAYIATSLAAHSPAHLILFARSAAKVEPVISSIAATDPSIKVTFISCELADRDSVHKAAATILDDPAIPHIDVIINNAGLMTLPEYTTDSAGVELQLSANHLGPFLLTNLLLPKLAAAGPEARVVNVSSDGHKLSPFRFEDWNFSGGKTYDGWTAYGQTKTANILFTVELARRGITAFAAHPGVILTTNLGRHLDLSGDPFKQLEIVGLKNTGVKFAIGEQKTVSQGAAAVLVPALDPKLKEVSGAYFEDCQVAKAAPYSQDAEAARKLWALSEELVGEKFPDGK